MGTRGDYVADLARVDGDPVPRMLERIEATMERFRIHFDSWAKQSDLERELPGLLAALPTYEEDGATFVRSTEFGDEKDRVLVRSAEKGGLPTYEAADVAYLRAQARTWLRPRDLRARCRPSRRRRLVPDRCPHARLRPGSRRGAALPTRASHPRRRADQDVEAAGRRRLPRRVSRRDRGRRRALVPRQPRPRPDDRDRHRPRRGEERQESGLLRPVRACPDRRDPAQRGRRADRRRSRGAARAARAAARKTADRASRPSFGRRRSIERRRASRSTRSRSRTTSTASTTTSVCSIRSRKPSGSGFAGPPSA